MPFFVIGEDTYRIYNVQLTCLECGEDSFCCLAPSRLAKWDPKTRGGADQIPILLNI